MANVTWIATVGISWPDGDGEGRAEVGDVVPTAVVEAAPWLIEQGHVVAQGADSDG
jgi:hypothetical protein